MSERVPEGWGKGALGNVCSSIRGVSYKPEDLRNVRSTQTVTLLRSNNIQERGIDFQNVHYVDISKVKQKQMMCDRDIAVCMSNGSKRLVGKNATLYDPLSSETFTVGAFCSIVRAKEKSSYQFIRHLLKSNDFKQQVEFSLAGSAINNLKDGDVENYIFLFPPLPEQNKIASILTSVDEVIETTQKQIDKFQDLKKATMNELLTKGTGHTEFKDSELGRIPKSWEVTNLDSISRRITDGTHQAVKTSTDGEIPFLYVSCVKDQKILWEKSAFISEAEYSIASQGRQPDAGDILYTSVGSYGNAVLVEEDKKFCFQRHIALIQLSTIHVIPKFVETFLISDATKKQADKLAVGNAQLTVTLGELKKVIIALPPMDEQQKICQILEPISHQLDLQKQKLTQTQSLKKSLMQDLLTGKVRVKVN